MTTIDTTPSFSLDNPGAPDTLFISAETKDNTVTLSIVVPGGASFAAASPVPYEEAGAASGSLLYLDLSALALGAATLETFALVRDGWASKVYAADKMIAIAPTADVTIAAGDPLTFELTGFVLPQSPGQPSVTLALDIFHVRTIATGAYPALFQTLVALAKPSHEKNDLREALDVSCLPSTVVTSRVNYPTVVNHLQLILAAKGGGDTVTAGSDTVFTLSVVYASDDTGYGALMTEVEGSEITIPPPVGSGWRTTNVAGTAGRSWQLTPSDGQVLPGPGGTSVAFDLSPVITFLRPGPTVVLLTYSDVPGYKDGAFAVTLVKQPHVHISSFTANPPLSKLTNGSATVTLRWTSVDADALLLHPGTHNVTGQTSFTDTISDTTTYTLVAYGAGGTGVGNIAIANAQAVVVPVLDRLTSVPAAVAVDDFGATGAPLMLNWAVDIGDAARLQLESSQTGIIGTTFGRLASEPLAITQPQMFTLSIVGELDPLQSWKAYVPAFRLQPQAGPSGGPFDEPAAAPRASYVAACQTASNQVAVLSTASYAQIATVAVGSRPCSLVFAPDGDAFYVGEAGDGTVTPVTVTTNDQSPPWSFTAGSPISVGGAPRQLAYAPNKTLLAVVAGSTSGSLAAVDLDTREVVSVTVGAGASALAVTSSGAQVFVANTTDGTVSQIGRAADGRYQLVQTIGGLPGAAGIAITPDAQRVVVCCSDGSVRILDATAPEITPQTRIAVGGKPTALALDPSGAYAFVLDSSTSRLLMLSLAKGTLIGSPVTVAAGSTSVSISSDGMVALVGGSKMSVIALQTYTGRGASADCKGVVSDTVVTADGVSALTWANASVKHSHEPPAAGLLVYSTVSQTIVSYFTDRKIVGIALPTLRDFNTGILSILGESALYPLDCVAFRLGNPVTIPPKGGVAKRQPLGVAASRDGQTIFALVADDRAFSLVVYTVTDTGTYTLAADLPLFTPQYRVLSVPIVAAPDGSAAYIYDSTAGHVWTATRDAGGNFSLNPTPLSAHGQLALGFVIAPDGTRAYLAVQQSADTIFYVIETKAQTIQPYPFAEQISTISIQGLAISPDGTRLFATDQANGSVRVIDTMSLRFLQTVTWPTSLSGPLGIAINGDQSLLFAATIDGKLASATQVRPAPRRRLAAALTAPAKANGVFIRHQPGDTPGKNGGTFSQCPDIMLGLDSSNKPIPLDAKSLYTDASYATSTGNAVTQGSANYVYVRALNNAASLNPPPLMKPRLWLAYTPSNMVLMPNLWKRDQIQVDGETQNWQAASIIYNNATPGQLMVTSKPFVWTPPVLTDGNHYCMIALGENPKDDPAWMPNPGNFASYDDLVNFVLTTDWFGWRNTMAVQSDVPTWSMTFPIEGPEEESLANVGVKCTGMPIGAQFQFTAVGPGGNDGAHSPVITINDPNQIYALPMTFPAKFNTSISISFWKRDTVLPTGSMLIPYLAQTEEQVRRRLGDRLKRQPITALDLVGNHWTKLHPFGSISLQFQKP